jgi:hypothetical protein
VVAVGTTMTVVLLVWRRRWGDDVPCHQGKMVLLSIHEILVMFLDGVFLLIYRHYIPGSGPPMLINLLFFYFLMIMIARLPYFRRGMS